MRIEFTYLRSRLARRIFWLFVVCALLPISMLALVSLISVSSELKQQSRRRLGQASRDEGVVIFERLVLLDANLRTLAANAKFLAGSGKEEGAFPSNLETHFRGIALSSEDGTFRTLAGRPPQRPVLSVQEQDFVRSGKTLLSLQKCDDSRPCIYLVFASKGLGARYDLVVGEVRPGFLWSSEEMPESMDLCILDQHEHPLFCPRNEPQVVADHASGDFEWKQGSQTYLGHYWKLPLKSRFFEDHWTVVASETSDAALSSLGSFRHNFPLAVLLALWIVLFLSIIQIRRTLVPLEKLREGTGKVAAGELGARVSVNSRDEFKELATSFNYMAGQIETQVQSLKTLNEIDHAILSSWDLDHIVEGLISRLPALLTYDVAGITVIGAGAKKESTTYLAAARGSLRVVNTEITEGDLKILAEKPESFITGSEELFPQYLLPLVAQGMRQLLVLPIAVEGKPAAAMAFGRTTSQEWTGEERQQARRVADQVAVAFSNARLVSQLKELRWGTLTALARAIDVKSSWTAGHSERVTEVAIKIGREMGLSGKDIDILHAGGLLHDVGKIGIPASVLDKPGPLTEEERLVVQEHVLIGVRILKPIPGFEEYLPIVREHHEWFNGKGYPYGIAGENITIHARIFALADVYDALISDRPYRKGMPLQRAVSIIRGSSGTQFDPQLVDAFFRVLEREGTSVTTELEKPVPVAG